MTTESPFTSSDTAVLDLLRRGESLSVSELASEFEVTATAIRQRLTRLMSQGLIERRAVKAPRGRPGHRYALTEKGHRQSGDNFQDLASALWDEIRAVKDPEIRRGLIQRVAHRLAEKYSHDVAGETVAERMDSLAEVYRERKIPFEVERGNANGVELPVLKALACPYPDLAARDRSICAMERLMFAEVLETDLRLSQCRLDGGACCTFE